jgi:hypothetical protein
MKYLIVILFLPIAASAQRRIVQHTVKDTLQKNVMVEIEGQGPMYKATEYLVHRRGDTLVAIKYVIHVVEEGLSEKDITKKDWVIWVNHPSSHENNHIISKVIDVP